MVEPESDAAFQELGTRLFAELAPAGELEGFLVARLAAAISKTGRAERLEGQALQAPTDPHLTRFGLQCRSRSGRSDVTLRRIRPPWTAVR